ncbi:ABC transporter ATPase [Mycobacterium tuberculosis]|nr:ABC transporter ATPase [Mycobacterium tuberculosis]
MLIVMEGLCKRYPSGERPVVDGVNLHVEQGEFVAVMGPSGSGKSTLLNLMGGFDSPDQGKVCVDGLSLYDLSEKTGGTLRRSTTAGRHRPGIVHATQSHLGR